MVRPVIRSRGFFLWKKLEATRGRLTLEALIAEIGLSPLTVRRYVVKPNADVSTAAIWAAVVVADYFGVPLDGPDGLLDRSQGDS
ncbi:MAG: hypothetical protein ACLQVD_05000 [Capsulimonadaceae bacterium]